jgi:hypothetical protein
VRVHGGLVGLVDERIIATTYESVIAILQRVTRQSAIKDDAVMGDGEDLFASLRSERQAWGTNSNEAMRSPLDLTFTLESNGYEREAKEQRVRMSAVGLIRSDGPDSAICRICESRLEAPTPTLAQIDRSLRDLSDQLDTARPGTHACRSGSPPCWQKKRRSGSDCTITSFA